MWGAFDILLVEEKYLSEGFLNAIGQCGENEEVVFNVLYDADNGIYDDNNVIVA